MRYLLLILIGALLLLPNTSLAVTGQDIEFGFVLGKPALTVDADDACNDTAVARFGFVLGQPAVVYDADANCTAAVGAAPRKDAGIIWIDSD